jgi:hypothetical protein
MQRAGGSCTVESGLQMSKAENTKGTPREHQGNRISMAYLGLSLWSRLGGHLLASRAE